MLATDAWVVVGLVAAVCLLVNFLALDVVVLLLRMWGVADLAMEKNGQGSAACLSLLLSMLDV